MTSPPTGPRGSSRSPSAEDRLLAIIFPLALFVLWAVATEGGLVGANILPTPSSTARTLVYLFSSGEIWSHLAASLGRVVSGAALGAGLGLALGVALGLSQRARDYLLPSFQVFVYVPILAWLPILMLLLGLGETLKIVLVAKAVFTPVTLTAFSAIRDVPTAYVELGRVNGLKPAERLFGIVLPAALPSIWAGLRYAHSRAWTALLIVELLASSEGLGFIMVEGQQLLQLDVQIAAILVLAVVGVALDQLLAIPERRVARWRGAGFHGAAA